MPRLKFVATSIATKDGFQKNDLTTTAIYLESSSVAIRPSGTLTLIIDNVSKDQYQCSKLYSAVITALDSASASVGVQIDLT